MASRSIIGKISLERMVRAVEKVRERLLRAASALLGVGLIDASWCDALPAALAERLQSVLDDPDG